MRTYLIAAAALALTSSGAYAIDITNQDSRDVTVSVHPFESSPVTFKLKPGEMKADACPKTVCEILIEESGTWVATSRLNDQVHIRNGKPELGR